ncbi:MAG: response regulator transcription factor [Oscillospiraceae bacterium]|nr:response regulator transcription factor [Oscillospiraceae bacterium]
MVISALVCDDLPEERSSLLQMLRVYESCHDVELALETAASGTELLSMWRPGRWSIIFLDVYMPEMDGIEAARRLRAVDGDCALVLATTSQDHGIAAYELHALDYLTKPFSQQDVDNAMDWFLKQRTKQGLELDIRTQDGERTIRADEIRYIESRGHRCVIHIAAEDVSVRGSIDELSADISDAGFFRCHQSFLINFAHVSQVEKRAFLTDGGERIPISAANLAQSKAALLEWVARQSR